MSQSFNPYAEWLGTRGAGVPDYYELLAISRAETDPDRIAKAASSQLVRLRSVRPGGRVVEWRRIMEELETARATLSDPQRRSEYDAGPARKTAALDYQADPAGTGNQMAGRNLLPPGMASKPSAASTPAPQTAADKRNAGDSAPRVETPIFTPPAVKPAAAPQPPMPQPAAMPQPAVPHQPTFAPIVNPLAGNPLAGNPLAGNPLTGAAPGRPPAMLNVAPTPLQLPPGVRPPGQPAPPQFAAPTPAFPQPMAPPPAAAGQFAQLPRPAQPAMPQPPMAQPPMQHPVMPYPQPAPPGFAPSAPPNSGSFFDEINEEKNSPLDELGLGGAAASIPAPTPFPQVAPSYQQPIASFPQPTPSYSQPAPSYPQPDANYPHASAFSPPAHAAASQAPVAAFAAPVPAAGLSGAHDLIGQPAPLRRRRPDNRSDSTAILFGGLAVAVALVLGVGGYLIAHNGGSRSYASADDDTEQPAPRHVAKPPAVEHPSATDPSKIKPTHDTKPPSNHTTGPATQAPPTQNNPPANPQPTPSSGDPPPANPPANKPPADNPPPSNPPPANNNPPPATNPPTNPPATNPPANPPANPNPPPTPTDPPKTNPPPDQPQPKPADPADVAKLTKLLADVRAKLGQRKVDDAKKLLAEAGLISAKAPDLQPQVDQHDALVHYVDQFWGAVKDSIAGLNPTDEIDVGSTKVVLVEKSGDAVTLHYGGQNHKYKLDQLPAGFVVALASNWLDQKDPRNKLPVGAFYFVDPKGGAARAKQIWQEAASAGVSEVNALLPLLEEAKPAAN